MGHLRPLTHINHINQLQHTRHWSFAILLNSLQNRVSMVRHITQMAHLSCNHMQSMHITLVFSQNNDFSKNNITMYSGSQPEAKNNFPAGPLEDPAVRWKPWYPLFPKQTEENYPAVRWRTQRARWQPLRPAGGPSGPAGRVDFMVSSPFTKQKRLNT
jgi:hypothetical protein